jgi:hypothetical protein
MYKEYYSYFRLKYKEMIMLNQLLFVLIITSTFSFDIDQTLFRQLQEQSSEQLKQLLQHSGYKNVRLGAKIDENNVILHSCQNIQLIGSSQSIMPSSPSSSSSSSSSSSIPSFSPNARLDTSFLELEAGVKSTSPLDNLDCDCQPYSCSCQKQCFCRLSADPFAGTHYPPNANCPVCPSCNETPEKDDDDDDNPLQKPDYKCSCSFDGVGGAGISNGGYMNCDCRIADCSCSKQCACTSKKKKKSASRLAEGFKEIQIESINSPIREVPEHHQQKDAKEAEDTVNLESSRNQNIRKTERRKTTLLMGNGNNNGKDNEPQ